MNLPKINYDPLFLMFWDEYPTGANKGDKKKAQAAWNKLEVTDADLVIILTALKRQKKEPGWRDGFGIPHCVTYLNNARFMDEPIIESGKADNGWQRSNDGIIAKGRELKIEARAGETMPEYLRRILSKLEVSQ